MVVLLAVLACKRAEPPHYAADFDADTRELTLWRHGEPLLVFPDGALVAGVVDAYDDAKSYDPLFDDDGVRWSAVRGATGSDAGYELDFGDVTATMTLEERGDGRFAVTLDPDGPVAYWRLEPRVSPTEGFYGLGETFDTPEHRGKVRAMQFAADGSIESGYNEAHVPVPLLIGTTGWGLFVEDLHPGLFEVATEADDLVRVTFGVGVDGESPFRFHLFAADHPLDVTRRYYDTTGDPLLPARWAYGPWVWRDENEDQAQVLSDLETMRELDLAASAYWIDRPYATGVNSFDFDAAMFTDAQAMIDRAHALGYRMALWHTPYADPIDAPVQYGEAVAGGYFPPKTPPIVFNNWSHPLDFTNEAAVGWWQGWIRRYTDMGIEGFKLDYAEDIIIGANGARMGWEFADGSDERTMHRQYAVLYHQTYAEMLPESGGFLLCRAGAYGDQVNVSVIWPGDLDASLEKHRAPRPGEKSAVGGLPAAVSAALSLGPSGFPFFASDTGGYRNNHSSKETFTRWFQHTALSAVMQIGTGSNDVAWEFLPENGFDEEMLGWYRDYVRLHLRLFPYVWTYAENLPVDGRPILRPLGLAYPELGAHPPDTYLLGDHLLVAPVVDAGATTREVRFPPGVWVDWFTGEAFTGPAATTVDAPLDKLPLYLREGGIVPMLRPTIDTLSPVTEPDIESYASDPGELWVRVAPGPASTFTAFDGAVLEQERTDAGVRVAWTPGDEFTGAVFELLGVTGTAEGSWVEGGSTFVRLPAGGGEVELR